MNFCINCKHCVKNKVSSVYFDYNIEEHRYYKCDIPDSFDGVTGEPYFMFCSSKNYDSCCKDYSPESSSAIAPVYRKPWWLPFVKKIARLLEG